MGGGGAPLENGRIVPAMLIDIRARKSLQTGNASVSRKEKRCQPVASRSAMPFACCCSLARRFPPPHRPRSAPFAVQAAGPRNARRRQEGRVQGPGTCIVNFAFYKDIVRTRGFNAEFTALLDNAFNHPQFAVGLGTRGFMDLTDYLINGEAANGNTAVLDADTVGSTEGFSVGRVVRLGIRLRF